MKYEFVAGLRSKGIDQTSESLKKFLNCTYEKRDSSYLGEYNIFSCPESVIVQYNYVEEEGEWNEPEFKSFHVLVIVGETERPDYFRSAVENLQINFEIIKCTQWQ